MKMLQKSRSIPLIAEVILPLPFHCFDYKVPTEMADTLAEGDFVQVPFRRKIMTGVVGALKNTTSVPEEKQKSLVQRFDLPPLSKNFRTFLSRAATYTANPLGLFYKMMLGGVHIEKFSNQEMTTASYTFDNVCLDTHQKNAAETCVQSVLARHFTPIVLEGVTGSGKTEVYFHAIHHALQQGKSAMILLPEITLSTAWLQRFKQRFGSLPYVWHSHLTPKTRQETWKRITQSDPVVVVGARSALFLPFHALGVIVVDEEHDQSFKQETTPFYHARDLAILRAQTENFPVILASATPSLETCYNIAYKGFHHAVLESRYGTSTLPAMQYIDLKKHPCSKGHYISPPLRQALIDNANKGEQSLLFLNRRGYAPQFLCGACGWIGACPACSTNLVFHKAKNTLTCHLCGFERTPPSICTSCGQHVFLCEGPGVERLIEEVHEFAPHLRTQIMTSDTLNTPKKMNLLLENIHQGRVDVIIGTQSMAKGHHFPLLTLVGVVDGDMSHLSLDMRGQERAFQLIHQVAGRAGRAEKSGVVLIQTYQPEHPLLKALMAHDQQRFMTMEHAQREALSLPPYGNLTAVIISSREEKIAKETAENMARVFPKTAHSTLQVLGPIPAPIYRMNTWYRYRILLKSTKTIRHQTVLKEWFLHCAIPPTVKVQVDVDPHSFY